MKIIFLLIFLTLGYSASDAQETFTLNQGSTTQENYFTEIEYQDVRKVPIIKVTINGKEYRFVLDTGAPTGITKRLFDELKPKVITKMPVLDANNTEDSLNIVSLNELKIGSITFKNIPTVVSKQSLIFECLKVDGSIGSNMLRNSILRFSSKTHKIVITDQQEKLNPNGKQATDLFLNKSQSAPFVTINFSGKGSGSIPVLFDTGSTGFFELVLNHFIATEKAEVFSVQSKSKGVSSLGLYGFGSDTIQYRLKVPQLEINGTVFKSVNHNTTLGENSIIGAGLLKYGIITVDYKNSKFYFEPYETSFDLSENLFPISLIPSNNTLRVGMIWNEQLKEKMDINDQVLAIDGVDYTNVSACDIMTRKALFEGGSQAILTLRTADGKVKKVTIKEE
jgi:predicted aspartyl protease